MIMKPDEYDIRLDNLRRHIHNVQESGYLLAERLRKRAGDGDLELAHELVINIHVHDHSKFKGIEWEYLHDEIKESDPEKFKLAWEQHVKTNEHHPEFWFGISNMPRVFVAEMVCDWKARSSEFATDLREWVKTKATKKFGFTVQGKVYKEIKEFLDLLLDPAFS